MNGRVDEKDFLVWCSLVWSGLVWSGLSGLVMVGSGLVVVGSGLAVVGYSMILDWLPGRAGVKYRVQVEIDGQLWHPVRVV